MKVIFKDADPWFGDWICAEYLDEFHSLIQSRGVDCWNRPALLEVFIEYFTKVKGFNKVYKENNQAVIDLDDRLAFIKRIQYSA